MNISIFGLGYVGCIGLGCLAQSGHRVIGVDINPLKIKLLNRGESPIIETGINQLISEQQNAGRISATTDGIKAVTETDVTFVSVGTPSSSNGHTDTTAIYKVIEEISQGIKQKQSFHIVVIRSTVPPGTNKQVAESIQAISGKKKNEGFAIVSNPEFLREGTAIKDYYSPPFTLVASESEEAIELMRELYIDINSPFVVSDIGVAEIIKYVNNTFHALKITFANEIGNICKKLNIDSHKLMQIFCMDNKLNISSYYLKPGFAYGGSCLPKDLKGLKTIIRDLYIDCPVIENVERSNELQKTVVLERIISFGKQHIGFLGLSFKTGTDDLRNSPIIDIIEQLIGKGFKVTIYDNNINLSQLIGANKEYIMRKIPLISKFITANPMEIIENTDLVVVVNKEKEFEIILQKLGNNKQIYDLVNIDFLGRNEKSNYMGLAW